MASVNVVGGVQFAVNFPVFTLCRAPVHVVASNRRIARQPRQVNAVLRNNARAGERLRGLAIVRVTV